MRWGELGWVVCLAGLPFAHFLFPKTLTLWSAQATWAQAWVLGLSAVALSLPSRPKQANWPLTVWVIWVSGLTGMTFFTSVLEAKVYPHVLLMAFLHLLSLIGFYQAALAMWTRHTLQRLFHACAWVSVVVMFYAGLQLANLDQFFDPLPGGGTHDELSGTIGNPTHLAAYLSLTLPLLLVRTGWGWRLATVANGVLLLRCGSAAGLLGAWVGSLLTTWLLGQRRLCGIIAGVGLVGGIGMAVVKDGLNPFGRLAAWQVFWSVFVHRPITGFGPGFTLAMTQNAPPGPIHLWHHVHNEYLQIALEQGLIGLGLVLWGLVVTWRWVGRLPKTRELAVCAGILLVFLTNSLLNFPAHLWMLSSLGLMAYTGIYVLASEEMT